jgi:hypothetical protein
MLGQSVSGKLQKLLDDEEFWHWDWIYHPRYPIHWQSGQLGCSKMLPECLKAFIGYACKKCLKLLYVHCLIVDL